MRYTLVMSRSFGPLLALALVVGCSSGPESSPGASERAATACTANAECGGTTPLCDVTAKVCTALPQGGEIGYGDGSVESVDFTVVYEAGAKGGLIDLAFHPDKSDELWVIGYKDDSVHIGQGIGTDEAKWERRVDPAAGHFMHKPTAIAMGGATSTVGEDRRTWGVCGDNDNGQNARGSDGSANLFMGPALFSADHVVFAKQTPDGLGSHLDMLHNTPFCRGIAHETKNVYWVFNAYDESIDKYDFAKDHGPGNDDHADGKIYRYAEGQVKGATDGTPSHLSFDEEDGFVYAADTGNQRIVRVDPSAGKSNGRLPRLMERLADEGEMVGSDVEEVVPPGTLTAPAGLEIKGGLLYVTDAATSMFHVFDKSGNEVRSLDTGLPVKSLAGFTFGPDGKIYFVDRVAGRVLRIDPR